MKCPICGKEMDISKNDDLVKILECYNDNYHVAEIRIEVYYNCESCIINFDLSVDGGTFSYKDRFILGIDSDFSNRDNLEIIFNKLKEAYEELKELREFKEGLKRLREEELKKLRESKKKNIRKKEPKKLKNMEITESGNL